MHTSIIQGQPSDGPMGISVALTPSTTSAPLSKTFITNASFRTKKLPDDIPIQQTEDGKPLMSISEEGDGDDKNTNKPIRTPQGSGREKEKDKDKEKDKEKEGKEKKFATPNIQIPNLVKRKEKTKNGERKDGEKKSGEKKEKHKHDKEKEKDKENRNGTSSNRNSAVMNSDSDGNDVTIIANQQQQSQQQQYEMKVIIKSPRHYDTTNTSAEDITQPGSEGEEFKNEEEVLDHVGHPMRSPLEVNGGQNLITKM